MQGQGEFDFIKPFIEEHIICGLPGNEIHSLPSSPGENSLYGLFSFISHHFSEFARLAFQKCIAFFGLTRTYFSFRHNLLLIAKFYPLYIFACVGIPKVYRSSREFFLFSMVLIATFTLSVMVTCVDWHNRFIMPIMPFILLFSAVGILSLYDSVSTRIRLKAKG